KLPTHDLRLTIHDSRDSLFTISTEFCEHPPLSYICRREKSTASPESAVGVLVLLDFCSHLSHFLSGICNASFKRKMVSLCKSPESGVGTIAFFTHRNYSEHSFRA